MSSLRLTDVSFALIIAVACRDYSTAPTAPSPTPAPAPTPGGATSGGSRFKQPPRRSAPCLRASGAELGGRHSVTWTNDDSEARTADSDASLEFRSDPASREVLRHIRNRRHVPLSLGIRPGRVGRVTGR